MLFRSVFDYDGYLVAMITEPEQYSFGRRVVIWEGYLAVSCDEQVFLLYADRAFQGEMLLVTDGYRSGEFGFTIAMAAGVVVVGDPGVVLSKDVAFGAVYTFDVATTQQRETLFFFSEETDQVSLGESAATSNKRVWAGVTQADRKSVG